MSAPDWNPRAVRRRAERGERLPTQERLTLEFQQIREAMGQPRDRSRRRRKQRRRQRKRASDGAAIDV